MQIDDHSTELWKKQTGGLFYETPCIFKIFPKDNMRDTPLCRPFPYGAHLRSQFFRAPVATDNDIYTTLVSQKTISSWSV